MASVLSKLKSFFKGVWSAIKKVVPKEQLDYALILVKQAAVKFVDNDARRNYVIAELVKRFKIPESLARFITEAAVQAFKGQLD